MTIRSLLDDAQEYLSGYVYTVSTKNVLDWEFSYLIITAVIIFTIYIQIHEIVRALISSTLKMVSVFSIRIYSFSRMGALLTSMENTFGVALGGFIWFLMVFLVGFGLFVALVH